MKIYFTIVYVLFFISIFYLRLKIRKKTLKSEKIPGKVVAKWTSKYIFYVYLIIFFGSFIEYFIVRREVSILLSIAGVLLYVIGILGRQWACSSLGKYWSVDIEIRDKHELIRKGPYKFMRHPNNFFHTLEVIGIILAPNAFYMSIVFFITYLPILISRSIIEEKAMTEKLQDEYMKYKKESWGFCRILGERN